MEGRCEAGLAEHAVEEVLAGGWQLFFLVRRGCGQAEGLRAVREQRRVFINSSGGERASARVGGLLCEGLAHTVDHIEFVERGELALRMLLEGERG